MKKVLIGIVSIVVIIFVGLMAIPIFYDVNAKVKPQIQEAIENNLNVKAEIGKLSLSTLFGIRIGIESLKIIETSDNNVLFEMRNAKLKVPLLSLLTGRLAITLIVDEPSLRLNRDKQGKLNIAKLVKAPTETTQQTGDTRGGSASAAVGGRIAFSTDITNANIYFNDLQSGFDYKIEKLNFKSHKIGLNQEFDTEMSALLSIDNKKDILLNGQILFAGQTEITMKGGEFDQFKTKAKFDLTPVQIKYAALFNKAKDIPLAVEAEVLATNNLLEMKKVELVANTFKIKTEGKVENFTNPTFDITVDSNDLKLEDWKKIIKPLGDFDMEGSAKLKLTLKGSAEKPEYSGGFELNEGAMRVPGLAPRATQISTKMNLSTNHLEIQNASLKIGSSDMALKGSVKDFLAPQIDIQFNSKKLDLDEMLPQPPVKPTAAQKEQPEDPQALEKSLAQLEGPIAMIRQNEVLRKTNMRAQTNIELLKIKNAPITDIRAVATFKNLNFQMMDASVKAFNGTGKTTVKMDFSEKKPKYFLKGSIQRLDTNAAVVSQFKDLDRTITGFANATFDISGSGVTLADLNTNLRGAGNFNVEGGTWSGLGVLKVAGEKLKSIPKAGDIASGIKISDKFKNLKSDFNIGGGKVNLANGLMEMEGANTALSLSGWVAFTKEMLMKGDIIAPMGQVPKKLSTGDGRGKIPYEVGGKVNDPKVNWDTTLKPVAAAFAQQEGEKLLQKTIEKNIKNDGVKKLFKGFKF